MTFSPTDIRGFITRPNMRALTAVGNNGRVYMMEKLPGANEAILRDLEFRLLSTVAQSVKTLSEADKMLTNFFREAEKYGLRYYAGTDL